MKEFRREYEPSGEFLVSNFPDWLAGMFEAGGYIGIDRKVITTKRGQRVVYTYPAIVFGDNDLRRIQGLQRLAGGKYRLVNKRQPKATYSWYVYRKKALYLARLIRPFAPSRQETIFAFENWENTESREERLEISDELRSSPMRDSVAIEDYLGLVRRPDFMAGVVDARGIIDTQEDYRGDYGWIYPRLMVNSCNLPLLHAVSQVWGGSVWAEGRRLKLGKRAYFNLKSEIEPNLRLRAWL